MKIRCVVSCRACDGTPDFFATTVEVDQDGYDEGEHYELAKEEAEEEGFEDVGIVYDENDGPDFLFDNLFKNEGGEG